MKIWKKLVLENIFLDVQLQTKDAVLRFIADACMQNKIVTDADTLYEGLNHREHTMSTGVGHGIALPHTTNQEVSDAAVLLIRPAGPVEFESLDNLPADIILALVIPEYQRALHIRILASVSRLCKHPNFLSVVRESRDSKILRENIRNIENKMAFH